MIHAFALEPRLVATWGRLAEFRFIHDKFGLGTPRVLLELPAFSKWKRDVHAAAKKLELSPTDMKRIEELFRLFSEHKSQRANSIYSEFLTWLENAEREYDRRPYAAILATDNPRRHPAVLVGDQLGSSDARWAHSPGATAARTPEGLDAGKEGETDDLLLLPRAPYELRWAQYVGDNGAFERIDSPASGSAFDAFA